VSRIEQLKEEARGFEQDEQWGKALDIYSQAIDQTSAEDTPDIALFNRAGDFVGIYYYLGLAHETVGDKDTALGFYDRVFALDINFVDVTERPRAPRT
jgi:tetratricopeptide (TPR) repeat protein